MERAFCLGHTVSYCGSCWQDPLHSLVLVSQVLGSQVCATTLAQAQDTFLLRHFEN
jgi:hypothetical protein